MTGRERIEIPTPAGGWPKPWPQVAELVTAIGPEHWTLVGGLMVQLHAANAGIDSVRPTADVDIVVHIETGPGRVADVANALARLGYEFTPSIDPRNRVAHRFVRGSAAVDLSEPEQIDVVRADHAAPKVVEKLKGYDMIAIEGGTQALKRTVNAALEINGQRVVLSVPNAYGALILKSAAHLTDSRDKARHLTDAVVLLACIDDPFAVAGADVSGSDANRMRYLAQQLNEEAWIALSDQLQRRARAALSILLAARS